MRICFFKGRGGEGRGGETEVQFIGTRASAIRGKGPVAQYTMGKRKDVEL